MVEEWRLGENGSLGGVDRSVVSHVKKSDESANYPAEKGKSWQFYAIAVPRGQDRKGPQGTMVRSGPDISGPQDRVVRSLVADYRTGTAPFRGLNIPSQDQAKH